MWLKSPRLPSMHRDWSIRLSKVHNQDTQRPKASMVNAACPESSCKAGTTNPFMAVTRLLKFMKVTPRGRINCWRFFLAIGSRLRR